MLRADDSLRFAPVLPLPILQMARFRRQMQHQGHEVDLARMCIDRAYACECLALAHASSDERLRQEALALFAAYDRNGTVAATVH
ncbi:hypothetical protein ACPOLB_09720 [Rubrivivax sp. RP6-9]|uniref:hypothetical protein n=1 Tax=Rubrivivax sp. RP6-9 TaxID=3415750 RepID=UPI003CC5D739